MSEGRADGCVSSKLGLRSVEGKAHTERQHINASFARSKRNLDKLHVYCCGSSLVALPCASTTTTGWQCAHLAGKTQHSDASYRWLLRAGSLIKNHHEYLSPRRPRMQVTRIFVRSKQYTDYANFAYRQNRVAKSKGIGGNIYDSCAASIAILSTCRRRQANIRQIRNAEI